MVTMLLLLIVSNLLWVTMLLTTYYNVNIVLKYENKTIQLPVKVEIKANGSGYCVFEIAPISVDNFSEVIFKLPEPTGTQEDTGPNDNELEDKENVETEENEVKTREYPNESMIFSKISTEPVESDSWFCHNLGKITDNLLEKKCEIHNKEPSSEALPEIGLYTLSRNLKEAFLNEEDSDITVKVGDKKYAAHKVILRNRSPVFFKMLQHDMVEKNEAFIDIKDCDPHVFRDFLLYLYTGKLDKMTKDNVFKLYYMLDKYEVNELKSECVDFILNNLDTDIICDVITLATNHLEQEMLKHAISFFISNTKDIFLTTKWQIFLKEYPIQANELIIKAFNNVTENNVTNM